MSQRFQPGDLSLWLRPRQLFLVARYFMQGLRDDLARLGSDTHDLVDQDREEFHSAEHEKANPKKAKIM